MAKKITSKEKVNATKAKTKKTNYKAVSKKTTLKPKIKKTHTTKVLLTKPTKKTKIIDTSKIIPTKRTTKKEMIKKASNFVKPKAKKLVPKAKTLIKKIVVQHKAKMTEKKNIAKLTSKKELTASKNAKVQPQNEKVDILKVKVLKKPITKANNKTTKKNKESKTSTKKILLSKKDINSKNKLKPSQTDIKKTIDKRNKSNKLSKLDKKIISSKITSKKNQQKTQKPVNKKPVTTKTFASVVKTTPKKHVLKEETKKDIQSKTSNKLIIKPINKTLTQNTTSIDKETPKIEKTKIIIKPKIIQNSNALKFESNYNRADMFYKNVLKAEILNRYSALKDENKDHISKDKNLTIKLNDIDVSISEKSRDQDWNDIFVEVFKKYPNEMGWIKYTEADYLAYFFPGRVFWAKMEPIKNLCEDILSKAIDSGIYKELYYMYTKNSGRLSKTFKINTKTYSFNFIQTYIENGDNSYYSIGISLPFVLLMDFRIDYKIFKQ